MIRRRKSKRRYLIDFRLFPKLLKSVSEPYPSQAEAGSRSILTQLQNRILDQIEILLALLLILAIIAGLVYLRRAFGKTDPQKATPPESVRWGLLGKVICFPNGAGQMELPYAKQVVYTAVMKSIPMIEGMRIERADRSRSHIVAETEGPTRPRGERISVFVEELAAGISRLSVFSEGKAHYQLIIALISPRSGALMWAKHKENVAKVIDAAQSHLASTKPQAASMRRISSQAQRISRLRKQLDQGLISNEEFKKKTAAILKEFDDDLG